MSKELNELSEKDKAEKELISKYHYAKVAGYSGSFSDYKKEQPLSKEDFNSYLRAKAVGYEGDLEKYKKDILKKK